MSENWSRDVMRSVTDMWGGGDPTKHHEVIVQRVEYRQPGRNDHAIDGGTIVRPVISITFVVGRGLDEKAQTIEGTYGQISSMRDLLDLVVGVR